METLSEARDMILTEIRSDDSEVRTKFLEKFDEDVVKFSNAMAEAVVAWRGLDVKSAENQQVAYVSAIVFLALNLQVQSMKLFLSGQIVAAGNVFRQAVESIALAILCSDKKLGVLERFVEDKYSTNNAVRDVQRLRKELCLSEAGIAALCRAQEFHHKYSHPTKMTIAAGMSFSEDAIYVGSSFDQGKLEAYEKEVNGRVGLAKVLANLVEGVKANVAKW